MRVLLLTLLIACSSTPRITAVEPSEVQPGLEVTVFGESFNDEAVVYLVTPEDEQRWALEELTASGTVILKGRLSERVPSGTYDVVVEVSGRSGRMVGGLAVQSPPPDVPCGGDYTANTQVSLARKIVVVERFYRDGARETVRTPLKDITRVEIERIQQAKGGHCSVIYMRLKNGTRIRFAESLTQDLKARGFKLAADLKTQVEVTRLDGVTVDAEVE